MATLASQTQWHGNPRPVTAYASAIFDGTVASPYYIDGRDVPLTEHIVTANELSDFAPGATNTTPGPAVLVEFTLDGVWTPTNAVLDITIVRTDGLNGDYVNTFKAPAAMTAVEMADYVASVINEESDLTSNNAEGIVIVSALAPVTALTITVLTVT
jgi:hypothetical protein